jgi:hypothetical protein
MPWSRSSRAERGQGGTLSHGGISMQISVERYATQPVRDGQSTDLPRKKSSSGLTDTSSIASIPPIVTSGSGRDFARGYWESRVGFNFTGGKATRHVLPTYSPGPNAVVGAPENLVPYQGSKAQYPLQALSPPRPLVRQQEQEQPEQTYPRRLPHSFA